MLEFMVFGLEDELMMCKMLNCPYNALRRKERVTSVCSLI